MYQPDVHLRTGLACRARRCQDARVGESTSNAVRGFADGARYQSARPGYPVAAVAHMVQALRIGAADCVVDVAAGTGLFTREIVPFCSRLIAVEPSAGMRLEFERQELGVPVLDGFAESLPFADHSVDVVTVAQAFHWFNPVEALAEFTRVLVAGGGLGLVWNERDDSVAWVDDLNRAMRWHEQRPYEVGMDFIPTLEAGGFARIEMRSFRHAQLLDRATLLRRVLTTSYIAVMDEAEQQVILDDVARLIENFEEPFELPHLTTTYCAFTPRS